MSLGAGSAQPSAAHGHAQADVADLAAALAAKAALAHTHAIADVTTLQAALDAKELATNKGVASGYASLGADGKVPTSQLPASSGGANIKEVELDFGATPVFEKEFTVADIDVLATSQLLMNAAYVAPTGRDLDEVEMEPFSCRCAPDIVDGQLTAHIIALEGPVEGKYRFSYLVG